jgi:ATP-binding cassette subfamily C protein CydD
MRSRWLKDAAAGRDGTPGLLLLDTFAAIGFAAGIAGRGGGGGAGAVLPWALLAIGMGMARGWFAMLAVRQGAARAGRVKRAQRRRVVAAALFRQAGMPLDSGQLATQAVDAVEALDGFVARFLPHAGPPPSRRSWSWPRRPVPARSRPSSWRRRCRPSSRR